MPNSIVPGEQQVLAYHAAIERNRLTFALQHGWAFHAFFGLCECFSHTAQRLQGGRNADGKSLVSLIPFFGLAQRQTMNAFEAFASFQSYDGWMLFRPALESALIMGKWIDGTDNAAIWNARETRKAEYIKAFTGKGLVSAALPNASSLKGVLDFLNDEFVHANKPYYHRHTRVQEADAENVSIFVQFFDSSDDAHVHLVAFLHLASAVIDAVDQMLAVALSSTGRHLPVGHQLRAELDQRRRSLLARIPEAQLTLTRLGLWPTERDQDDR